MSRQEIDHFKAQLRYKQAFDPTNVPAKQLPPADQLPPAKQMPPAKQQQPKTGLMGELSSAHKKDKEGTPAEVGKVAGGKVGIPQEVLKKKAEQYEEVMGKEGSTRGIIDALKQKMACDKAGYSGDVIQTKAKKKKKKSEKVAAATKWRCKPCGYIATGEEPPDRCPECGAPKSAFVKVSSEKTASIRLVDAIKYRMGGMDKVARAGHPANIALARSMHPGMLPGMDANRPGIHVSYNGSFSDPIAQFLAEGADPLTVDYMLTGGHHSKHATGPAHEVESTQDEDIEQSPAKHMVATKEQEPTETEPKDDKEKEASQANPYWFELI